MSKSQAHAPHLLIVEARFYDDLADALLAGAKGALDEANATYEVITVPGALVALSLPDNPAVHVFAMTAVNEGER